MGKFQPEKMKKIAKERGSKNEQQIKRALERKTLLSPEKSDDGRVIDGVLLFGKHTGKRISELLNGFDTVQYVTKYLMTEETLPKKFRETIGEIIDNHDPFSSPRDLSEDGSILKVSILERISNKDRKVEWNGDDLPF